MPLSKPDLHAYRKMGLGYWLTLCSVASAFFAEIIGFLNLFVMEVGTSVLGHYISWLGLDRQGFLDATLDPHSHIIAIAIMAAAIGVAAVAFRTMDAGTKIKRAVAGVGLGITILGVLGTSLILGVVAFFNYEPPTLFPSAGGVNGMAGDDAVMAIVLIGALVLSAALLWDRASRRDAVKVLFAASWAGVFLLTLVEGVYIEFHETVFQNSGLAKDAAYSTAHPLTGIFLLPTIALGLLLLNYYRIEGRQRRVAGWAFGLGLGAAVVGSTIWTFADPAKYGAAFWLYIAGTTVSYLAILATGWSIQGKTVQRFERSVGMDPGSLRHEATPPGKSMPGRNGSGAPAALHPPRPFGQTFIRLMA